MRTFTQKLACLLMVLLCCLNVQLKADELTVNDGTATNLYVPLYGFYADTSGKSQFVVSSDDLSGVGSISGLTFYASSDFAFTAVWEIKLMETSEASVSSAFLDVTGATLVYTGTIAISSGQASVVFDNAFTYSGENNLLVEVALKTTGNCSSSSSPVWYGVNTGTSRGGSGGSPESRNFLPKVTFTYTPGAEPSCAKPETFDVTGVTASSAAFTWAGGSGTYNLEYKKASADKWTVVLESTTATTHTLTGLEANTAYQARVNCVCGDDASGYKSINFTTPIALPYVQPFDASSTPNGWGRYNGIMNTDGSVSLTQATYYYWDFGTNNSIFGSSHAYGSCQYYSSASYHKWLVSPVIPMEEGLQLSFDLALTTYSGNAVTKGNQNGFEFVVLYSVDGGANWVELRRWNNTGSTYVFDDISSTGEEIELELTDLTSGNAQFAFYLIPYSSATSSSVYIHIDNVRIGAIPTCKKPTGLAEVAGKATKNSIQVTWSPVTSETEWKVQYKKASDSEWSVLTATDTIATISGLLAFTDYNVRVAAVCGEELTDYGNQITVKTAAGVPFEQSFAKSSLPSEWKRYTGLWEEILNGAGELEAVSSGWSTIYKTSANANGVFPDSTYHLYLNIAGTDCNSWLVSPTIEMEAGYQLTFNMSLTPKSATSPTAVTAGAQNDDQFILAIYDDENGWTPIRTWDNSSSAFDNIKGTANGELIKLPLDAYAGKAIQIAFYGESTAANGDNNLHIQNLKIATIPACENTTSLDVTAIGGTTATLVWDAVGGATWQYFYMVKPEGEFTPTDDKFTNSSDGYSVELTGLSENTDYVFYFRRKCGDTEYSDILMREFKTIQTPSTIPFSDNFEGGNKWILINGTQTNAWVVGEATAKDGAKSLYISNDGGTSNAYTDSYPASYAYATKSFYFEEAGVYSFSFDWKAEGYSSAYYGYLRVALAPMNAELVAGSSYSGLSSSATPTGWLALDGGEALRGKSTWQHISYDLNIEEAGNYKVVLFWYDYYYSGTNPAAIDNFSISKVNCTKPSGLKLDGDPTATSAAFAWTDDQDGNSWAYAYALASTEAPADDAFTNVDNNSVNIDGLAENSNYIFYLRKNCGANGYSESIQLPFKTLNPYQITINDGTTTNEYVPVNGYNADYGTNGQFIIPAATLDAIAWDTITNLTFYSSTASVDWGSNEWEVYMAEVSSVSISSEADWSGLTKVKNAGTLSVADGEMAFALDAPFQYKGGNLLIGFKETTSGSYKRAYWYGVSATGAAISNDANYSGTYSITQRNFLPKMAIEFKIGQAPQCSTPKGLVAVADSLKSDSAFVKWTEQGTASTWILRYRKSGVEKWDSLTVNVDSLWLEDLTPATTYEVQVASWCDPADEETITEFSGSIEFTTACVPVSEFPWSENFNDREDANIAISCWENEHITGNGTYVFEIEDNAAKLPDMSNGTLTLLSLPEMNLPAAVNGYRLKLDVYRKYYSTIKYKEGLRIYASATAQLEDTVLVAFIPRERTVANATHGIAAESADGWCSYKFNLPVASGACRIFILGVSEYGNPTYFDNLLVEKIPDCQEPEDLAIAAGVDSITTTTARLTWTALNGETAWNIQYRKASETEWSSVAANANPFELTGLTPSTVYYARVAAACTSENSAYSDSISFITECAAISVAELPYSQNFDEVSGLPLCWAKINTTTYSSYQGYPTVSGKELYFNSYMPTYSTSTNYDPQDQYAILPEMENINTLRIKFDARKNSSYNADFVIGVMSDPADTATFVVIDSIKPASSTAASYEVKLDKALASAKHIAIKMAKATSSYRSVYIDNVVVEEIPNCLEPAGAISVKDITAAGATLFWNNEEATSWKYAIALASDAEPADDAFVAIADTFKVMEGLSENSAYIFYLRRDCESLMSPSISASFTTKQTPADPTDFSDNFEGAIGWQFINGNLTNAWVIDTAAHKDGEKAMYISNDGGQHNKYTTSSAPAMVYAAKLFNFAETGTYKVDFDWLAGGESSSDYMRVVLVPDSIALAAATTTPSGFSSSALPQAWNAIAVDGGSKLNLKTSWQHFSNDEVLVDKAGLYKLVFAWRNDGSVGNDTAATVDNFSIEKLSCVKPSALAAKLTEGNGSIATLSWKKGDAESEWVVNYSLKADLSDSIEVAVTDTFINLTGLMSDSTYYARVLSVCGGTRTNWTEIISFTPTNAVTLTINKGTQTNSLVPISSTYLYQYYYEEGSRSQFIIPADSLTDVQWGKIKQLTFFSSSATFSFGDATFEVYMADAPAATFASDAFTAWTSMEKVMSEASLSVEGNKMVVMLDEPYDYTGGDLLIGFKSVASAYLYSTCYWQGVTATNAAVASEYEYDDWNYEYYEYPTRQNFSPKMTISYEPGEEPSCLKPTGLTVAYNGGDSAVVNWTSDAASWNLDINGVVTAVSAKPYTIHGLSLSTAYAVKVQAVCGQDNLSEWTSAQNFATDICNAEDQQSISYTLSDSYGDGWNGGATLKVVHKATSKEIAALTLSSGSSSNGTLPLCCGEEYSFVWVSGTFDSECSFVIKDIDDATILSRSNPTAGSLGDYTMVCPTCIKPSAVVIPDSTITATTAVVHWTAGHSSQTAWQIAYDTLTSNQPDTFPTFRTVTAIPDTLKNLLPEHTYFVYVRAYCGPADSSKWANVKSFTTASLCQKPSGLAQAGSTASSLTISWNTFGQTGFNLRYGTDGVNWTTVSDIETSPYTIEGLTASTSYKVQLQAACAAAEANSWTTSLSAKTAYGVPFEEPFNASSIPTDWKMYTGLLSDIQAGTASPTAASYGWSFGTGNGIFNSHAKVNIYSTSTKNWLVTPTIQLTGNVQLTFDIALSYWNGTLSPATAGEQEDDKFIVLISTDEGATWSVLRQWDNAGSEYVYDNIPCTATGEQVTINLSAYSGQGVKLAFYGESTIAGGDNYLHVDNVLVDLIPTCLKPTKFNVSNVKAHTAKLAWTAGEEGQTAWQIAIDSVDFKPDTLSAADLAEILIDVTDTPYVVSGLKPEHTYYVYVRANCGSEDGVSRWSDKKSFTTTVACPAPTGLQAYLTPGNGAVAGLKWNAGDAESWTVQYGTDNTFADGTYVELGDLPYDTIGLTSLTAEATYYARVKANCGSEDGESEWSSIVSFVPTSKYQLLINDGTATNEFIPVYGWYVDYLTRSQFIIPAETLEPLQWDTIKHLTFYTSSPANVNYGAATFEIFVAEVDQKTFASNALYDWTEMDTVMAAGSLSVSGNKMEVEFTKPYQYQDGNLLIGIKQGVKGSATHTYWYGVTATGASLGGYQGTSGLTISQQNFLPKMLIEFVPGVEPLCKDPKHLKIDEVTAHSATFSWGAQLGANWRYSVTRAGEQSGEIKHTTANTVTVEGLDELTDYVFYLCRDCGEDGFSHTVTIEFTTEAHITTVPFADDFEGANYWQLVNGSMENAWVIGSAVANAGNRSLYISNDGGQNNTYKGDAQAAVFATLLIRLDKDSTYVFQYDWRCEGEYYEEDGALDYMRVAIVPATVETAAGLTPPDGFAGDALPAGWIALDGGQALVETDAWQHVSVDTALTAGDYKVVIAWVNDEADAGETAAAIDNFSIAYKPGQTTGFNDGLIDSDKAVKFIRNNHVYILVNGRIYDATGRRVK